ncbi:MAG: ATP-dependent zinc protease [Desulfohalobiaceae bacterium]|nr:ATP-dependent zinc protease [Desulfohalobiaceae bacterium]
MAHTIRFFLLFLITVLFLWFTAGCGVGNHLISKKDLSRVNDRLTGIENKLDDQSTKSDLLLSQHREQKQLFAQVRDQNTQSLQTIQTQIQQAHAQTEKKLTALERDMSSEQQSGPDMQPFLENSGTDKFLVGRIEEIRLSPPSRIFHARIDTGANTSSLDARDLQAFERDGNPWVRFEIQDPKKETQYTVEKPVVRHVKIIQASNDEKDRRPVIELQFQIGRVKRLEEFTLEDRAHMDYQVLIGRNILRDLMVVDVAQKFLAPLPQEKSNGKND